MKIVLPVIKTVAVSHLKQSSVEIRSGKLMEAEWCKKTTSKKKKKRELSHALVTSSEEGGLTCSNSAGKSYALYFR